MIGNDVVNLDQIDSLNRPHSPTLKNAKKCEIRFTGKTTSFQSDFQTLNTRATITALSSNIHYFANQILAVLCVKWICLFWIFLCCMRSKKSLAQSMLKVFKEIPT